MTSHELADLLTVIAVRAKDLRDAGVVGEITIGEVRFQLGEPPVEISPTEDEPVAPLDDEDTFGGEMPRRRQRRQQMLPPSSEEKE